MALVSMQPQTEMNRDIYLVVMVAGVWGWQPFRFHWSVFWKYGSHNFLEITGPVQELLSPLG
jgi:hypothetical protein